MDNELTTNPKAPPTTAKFPAITGQTGVLPVPRAKSGRFLPGNRANPHGRPKGSLGSLNEATIFARALLEESAPAVARKAIEEAKQGNSIAMKLVLDRTISIAQDRAVNLNLPEPGGVPDDILASHTSLVQAMAAGEITPQEALIISQVLEANKVRPLGVGLESLNEFEERGADQFGNLAIVRRLWFVADAADGMCGFLAHRMPELTSFAAGCRFRLEWSGAALNLAAWKKPRCHWKACKSIFITLPSMGANPGSRGWL